MTATMESTSELGFLFASSAREAVLRVLLLDPTRPYYQRQLEQATGLPIRAIQREMERLTSARLLYRNQDGNRVYYRVNLDYVFFPELRSMVLKTSERMALLRAQLATDPAVRAAFARREDEAVLIVVQQGMAVRATSVPSLDLETISVSAFLDALKERDLRVESYLQGGVDLLGRRDDVLWRHIEAAGFSVARGAGVP